MGSLNWSDLWAHETDLEVRQSSPTHAVGQISARSKVSIMRVGVEGASAAEPVVFLGPIKPAADVYYRRREKVLAQGTRLVWWQLEAYLPIEPRGSTKLLDGVTPEDQLVVAEHPWSHAWAEIAPLRRASTHGVPTPGADIVDLEGLLQWSEGLANSPWFTESNRLGAEVARTDYAGPVIAKDMRHNLSYVFGVGRGVDRLALMVRESEDIRAYVQAGLRAGRFEDGKCVPIPTCLRGDGVTIRELMGCAVRLAMAGPTGTDEATEEWIGRPVSTLGKRIFVGLLDTYSKWEGPVAATLGRSGLPRERGGASLLDPADLEPDERDVVLRIESDLANKADYRRTVAMWLARGAKGVSVGRSSRRKR